MSIYPLIYEQRVSSLVCGKGNRISGVSNDATVFCICRVAPEVLPPGEDSRKISYGAKGWCPQSEVPSYRTHYETNI